MTSPNPSDPSLAKLLELRDAFDPIADPTGADFLRQIMNAAGSWRWCRSRRCRRARACCTPKVDCGWRNLPWVRREVLPEVRRQLGTFLKGFREYQRVRDRGLALIANDRDRETRRNEQSSWWVQFENGLPGEGPVR